MSGTDYEGKTVQWTTGKTQCRNTLAVKQRVVQHQGLGCLQAGSVVPVGIPRCHCPRLPAPSLCLWAKQGQVRACSGTHLCLVLCIHSCHAWHTHTRFCHVCCGFRGCIQRKWSQLKPRKNWEHVSAINFTKKAAACLEMFRLVFQETYLTLPLYSSGILMPFSSLNMILEVIFHTEYNTEKNVVDFLELIMVVYQKLFSWLKTI